MRLLLEIPKIKNSHNFKNGVLYTIFSFINNGLNFIIVLLLAKFLLPAEYGSLNLYNTFVTLVSIFIMLGTTSYVPNYFFKKGRSQLWEIVSIILLVSTIILTFFSIIIMLFPMLLGQVIGIEIRYLYIGLFACYCQTISNLNLDIWRLEEKSVSYGIYSLSFAICNFLLTFFFIFFLKKGWDGRVYAQASIAGLYLIISLVFLSRRGYFKFKLPNKTVFKETLFFALPLIPHMVSFWLKQGLDRYFINFFHEQAAVGIYSFALNFGSIITIVGTAFNATNSVYIYKKLSEGVATAMPILKKQTNIMLFIFLVLSILVCLGATILIPFILPQYSQSTLYLIPICLGAFFQCIYLLWVNYLFYFKMTKQLMYITFTTSLLQAVLSCWLTRYGIMWTACISMVIAGMTMLLVFIKSKHRLSIVISNVQ